MAATLLSLVIGALIIHLLYKWLTKPSLPRGPRGRPLVGNAFQVDPTGLHKTLAKWAETYGGVFTINLLGQNIVVLNSNEAIYEALVLKEDDFSGRPQSFGGEKVIFLVYTLNTLQLIQKLRTQSDQNMMTMEQYLDKYVI